MRRPGPLKDLPLERFLLSESHQMESGLKGNRPNKRPRSPGGPNLYSPTKRRILTQEGVFSPEKTVKSPVRGRPSTSGLFGYATTTPKKLDFGPPKNQLNAGTDDAAPTHLNLAPSPKLKPTSHPDHSPSCQKDAFQQEMDAYFSSPHPTPSARRRHPSAPMLVPREMPPPPDPASVHYPGFVIYQDTHILIPTASGYDVLEAEPADKAGHKENLPPRRVKVKKSATEPATVGAKSPFLPSEMKRVECERGKGKSTSSTPRKLHPLERMDALGSPFSRPKFGIASLGAVLASPARHMLDKKLGRQILEADAEGGFPYDVDELEDEVMF